MAGTEGMRLEPLLEAVSSVHGNSLSPVELGSPLQAINDQGYTIVKRSSRVELERAYEIAYGKEPDKHDAAVLLVAKRFIFGESLEMKV